MSIRLIKAGESYNFSAFNIQSDVILNQALRPAPEPFPPPTPVHLAAHAPIEEAEAEEDITIEALPDADEIIRAAKAEAALLVAEAQANAAGIERAARERGRAEAQAKAQTELNLAVADLRAKLAASLDELDGLRAKMAAQTEQDLVRLALEIAKKVVHREVKMDHEVALTLARVALARLHSRATATVRLHPDDYAYVSTNREHLGSEGAVEIIADRSVGQGGCIVQSELGEIDARIAQQFAEVERDFLSA
jgi:flagellar assembly protein FliH